MLLYYPLSGARHSAGNKNWKEIDIWKLCKSEISISNNNQKTKKLLSKKIKEKPKSQGSHDSYI